MKEEPEMATCPDCGERQPVTYIWLVWTHCRECGCPLDHGADESVLARVDWIAIDPEQVVAREALSQTITFSNIGVLIKENQKSN
ncbi:hypothetical protein LCGC14_1266910 [marine sediment metagenome]|uniref:Uncharacterized protein n=1 Tax=marine sediment metagenome TaxID=412755 RepID=A0A0F9L138_9ZZZZ